MRDGDNNRDRDSNMIRERDKYPIRETFWKYFNGVTSLTFRSWKFFCVYKICYIYIYRIFIDSRENRLSGFSPPRNIKREDDRKLYTVWLLCQKAIHQKLVFKLGFLLRYGMVNYAYQRFFAPECRRLSHVGFSRTPSPPE